MYSESRGFYYDVDVRGVQDAEEELRKAQQDKLIYEYQKEIERLQEEMKKATEAIDEQIKKLNEYSEMWGEVASKLEDSINAQIAAQILGQDWEQKILDQRLDTLQDFTDKYIQLQKDQIEWARLRAQAELDAQLTAGTSGTDAPGGIRTNPSGVDTTKDHFEFEGTKYQTLEEAQKAKEKYVEEEGKKVFEDVKNKYIKEHAPNFDKLPISAQDAITRAAEQAAEEARAAAENEARKKTIKPIKGIKAHFKGTSSAQRGESLVGEFGSEIVLHKNGTASIVDSPTLMDMEGGEKVFNAEETEDILKSKYKPLKNVNPKKFAMLHAFASGTSSPMQSMIAAQAVGIANGLKNGLVPALATTGGNQTINQTFNVSLPNITDSSKAQDLFREFEQLQRKATQFFN